MVIDTGIFIDHLRKKDKTKSILFSVASNPRLCLSVVTQFELLAGANSEPKKLELDLLINPLEIHPFNKETAKWASIIFQKLKSKNELIEFRDIFIAATCLEHDLPILTLNNKHFQRIEGLTLFEY